MRKKYLIGLLAFLSIMFLVFCVAVYVLLKSDNKLFVEIKMFQEKNAVTLSLKSLGEYPSTIDYVKISERQSGKILWEVAREKGKRGQFHTIEFKVGENNVYRDWDWKNFKVLKPNNSKIFNIERGKTYDVQVDKWRSSFSFGA